MKKTVILLAGLLIFPCAYAQNKIVAKTDNDTITFNVTELNKFIINSTIICSKIDLRREGGFVKTVEIKSTDSNSLFEFVYLESNVFYSNFRSLLLDPELKPIRLTCQLAKADNGQNVSIPYEFNYSGNEHFNKTINVRRLFCKSAYE